MQIAWKRVWIDGADYRALYDDTVYRIGHRTRSGDDHGLSVCASQREALAHDVPKQANRKEFDASGLALLAVLVPSTTELSATGKTLVRSCLTLCAIHAVKIFGEWVFPLAKARKFRHGFAGGYETRGGTPIRHPGAYRRRGWSSMVHVPGCRYSLRADLTDMLDHISALCYSLRRSQCATWR